MAKRICRHSKQFQPKWNSGETKPVRLPVVFQDDLVYLAKLVDSQQNPVEAMAKLLQIAEAL